MDCDWATAVAGAKIVMNVSITGNTLGDMEFEPDKHFQDW